MTDQDREQTAKIVELMKSAAPAEKKARTGRRAPVSIRVKGDGNVVAGGSVSVTGTAHHVHHHGLPPPAPGVKKRAKPDPEGA